MQDFLWNFRFRYRFWPKFFVWECISVSVLVWLSLSVSAEILAQKLSRQPKYLLVPIYSFIDLSFLKQTFCDCEWMVGVNSNSAVSLLSVITTRKQLFALKKFGFAFGFAFGFSFVCSVFRFRFRFKLRFRSINCVNR